SPRACRSGLGTTIRPARSMTAFMAHTVPLKWQCRNRRGASRISWLGRGPTEVERDHGHQLVVAHLGQQRLAPALEHAPHHRLLVLHEPVDALRDGAAPHELLHAPLIP